MAKLKDIVEFLDEYLEVKDIKDESWNGLQAEGKEKINKIVLAVDAGMETFEKAAELGADMVIVHHGNFWKSQNPSFAGCNKERLRFLDSHGISLYAAHLPLDRHRECGNNAQLLKLLSAEIKEEFCIHDGVSIGWIGTLDQPKNIHELAEALNKSLNTECKMLAFGNKIINSIAVCSGGGGYGCWGEFMEGSADLLLTGDSIEIYHAARDTKRNVIFAGHHATETVGVKALAEVVKEKFGIEAEFVDIPTGL